MSKFLADECVLWLKDSKYKETFSNEGWHLDWVGNDGAVALSSTDHEVYEFAVNNGFTHIITQNKTDFVSIHHSVTAKIKIVAVKKVYSPEDLLRALKIDLQTFPPQPIISIGHILSHNPVK